MVHRLDVNIGRVVDALAKARLTTSTIIAFVSDNGGPVDQNASLNGQKGILHEGGIRVQFIITATGTRAAGMLFTNPVSTLDLTPTFLAAAGKPATKLDDLNGMNLLPHLRGENITPLHDELLWRFTVSAAIRVGNWKLIRLPDRFPMLFKLENDFAEQNDVALDDMERTRDMMQRLAQWDVRLPHPLFLEGAIWKVRQLNFYDAIYPLSQPVGGAAPMLKASGKTTEK